MLRWLDDHLEEFLMAVLLLLITVIISYSVVMRYAHGDPDRYGERKTDGEYGEYITKHFIFLL